MKTAATEMFGLDIPVFAFSHCRDVVVETSRSGGMGVLGCTYHSPDQLRRELDWIERHVEGRPYGIDVLLPAAYARIETPRITLGDVAASGLGMNEQADFFSVKATLNYVLHNPDRPPWYQACPKDGCNKKVTAEGGSFFCAGCNMSYPNHEKRYIMRCTVVDHAAKQWMTAFNNAAVSIVGKTADEIAPMLSDPATAKTAFKPALFKQFILFCRAKNEEYNGDTRMKVQIDAAEPLDYATEARHLLSVIEQYA